MYIKDVARTQSSPNSHTQNVIKLIKFTIDAMYHTMREGERETDRSEAGLEGWVSVGGRFGSGGGGGSIDLVSVFQELLPGDYGGLAGSELHREHLPVTGLHERRRSPGRRRIAATNRSRSRSLLLFLHGRKNCRRLLGSKVGEHGNRQ